MPAKSLLSKRLSGIICDPVNPTIKPVARSQVQVLIDLWEPFSSPTIVTIGGGKETILLSTLITTLDDHKETAVLYYNNVVGAPNTLFSPRPLNLDPFCHLSHRVMSK